MSTVVYLIYQYERFDDTERHLVGDAYSDLASAKARVEKMAQSEFAYMQKEPMRYRIEGEMVSKWMGEGNKHIYEVTCESLVGWKGGWWGGLLRFLITPITVQEAGGVT